VFGQDLHADRKALGGGAAGDAHAGDACEVTGDGLRIHLGPAEGSYRPWWTRYEIQVVGWNSSTASVLLNAKPDASVNTSVNANHVLTLTLPANGETELQISSHP